MEDITTNIDKLYQKSEQYIKTSFEIAKLKTVDKTSDIISSLATSFIMILIVALFTLFINIGIAIWLGSILENTAFGFFIISGFYLLIGILVYFNRKNLIKVPVDNLVIKKLLKSDSRENDSNNSN